MPNITLSASGYGAGVVTFANYGPVTTTYTPPPSCTATERYRLGAVSDGFPLYGFDNVACVSTSDWDCVPSGTASVTITALDQGLGQQIVGAGGYYSPGLYCPSGWATVGVMARDDDRSLSSSGVLSASNLASLLQPSETLALCCPSTMTADYMGGCYSVVEDYEPTAACTVMTRSVLEFGTTAVVYTKDGTTRTAVGEVPTSTSYSVTTRSKSLREKAKSSLTGIAYAEMVTLIHHTSDFQSAASASGTKATAVDSSGTAATGTATVTSNAAARRAARHSSWDGLAAVLGVSVAAMALGAAIILPS